MDVEANPGPEIVGIGSMLKTEGCDNGRRRKYIRSDLLSLRKSSKLIPTHAVENLKAFGLFRYRGSRGGRYLLNKKVGLEKKTCETKRESPIPVIWGTRRIARNLLRCLSAGNLIPIARQPPKAKPTNRSFAVPKFLFTNICSLSKTKNRVRASVALEADLKTDDIDICIVSETHLKSEMPDSTVNIANYQIYRRDRNCFGQDNRSKGGIAVFVRSNLRVIDIFKSRLYELICLTIELPSGHRLFL